MAKTQQEIIKECFQAIDKDNSGFIDQAELEQLLRAYNSHPSCPAEFKANFSETEIKKQCKVCHLFAYILASVSLGVTRRGTGCDPLRHVINNYSLLSQVCLE
jgi:EF hand